MVSRAYYWRWLIGSLQNLPSVTKSASFEALELDVSVGSLKFDCWSSFAASSVLPSKAVSAAPNCSCWVVSYVESSCLLVQC